MAALPLTKLFTYNGGRAFFRRVAKNIPDGEILVIDSEDPSALLDIRGKTLSLCIFLGTTPARCILTAAEAAVSTRSGQVWVFETSISRTYQVPNIKPLAERKLDAEDIFYKTVQPHLNEQQLHAVMVAFRTATT